MIRNTVAAESGIRTASNTLSVIHLNHAENGLYDQNSDVQCKSLRRMESHAWFAFLAPGTIPVIETTTPM